MNNNPYLKFYPLFIIIVSNLINQVSSNTCPFNQYSQDIISARVEISSQNNSLVQLTNKRDTHCYNYTLTNAFNAEPNIAIAVSDMIALRATEQIFLTIKSLKLGSHTVIPFLIRSHRKHTSWNKITFSFLAEDKADIVAAYQQIDSGVLGTCITSKSNRVYISFQESNRPFRGPNTPYEALNHRIFLSGFQMITVQDHKSDYTPFQLQIVDSSVSVQGISITLSVNSQTQIHAIHLSYIVWLSVPNHSIKLISGSYSYTDTYSSQTSIFQHTPDNNIGTNYARIYGISGFKIQNQEQTFSYSTQWAGNRFIFDFGQSNSYLLKNFSFQYIFFVGSQCYQCPGYPFSYNNKCYAHCPLGTSSTPQNVCISCGSGMVWDGQSCIIKCPQGQFFNKTNNMCICPPGLFWTGSKCIICTQGRIFNQSSKTCQCPINQRWNGYGCIQGIRCSNGKQWDIFQYQCKCPDLTIWNGSYCIRKVVCNGGQIINHMNQCVCPEGMNFKNGWCQNIGCSGGQKWNGSACVCQKDYNWNGSLCLLCINGQEWNSLSKQCLCIPNTRWNGQFCEKYIQCPISMVYNKQIQKCVCPNGQYWDGTKCISQNNCCCGQQWNNVKNRCQCPNKFNFDGQRCVLCLNGKHWNAGNRKCQCPPGSLWNGNVCYIQQKCTGGMTWNQNTLSCQCHSKTVWNGNYCIANPCQGGQVWDNFLNKCICIDGKILISGICRPGEQSCSNGRKWNPQKYVCQCPSYQWDNGYVCQNIPQCISNQIYNPINNKCECPSGLIWLSSKNICTDTTCPKGQKWDGYGCSQITCPPNSFYNGTACVSTPTNTNCQPWQYFDGQRCVYSQDTCPKDTRWNGKNCISNNNCPSGFYFQNNICKPFPQTCQYPLINNGSGCVSQGTCPYGSYYTDNTCKPQNSCNNGQTWSNTYLQCVCPQGTGWNGNQCVICAKGQVWNSFQGCQCPQGHFFQGSRCQKPNRIRCGNIPNSYWDLSKNACMCNPGFSVVGYQCICKGIPFENYCDRCAHRPNSKWINNQCHCQDGYYLFGKQCLPGLDRGHDAKIDCSVGSFFDNQQKKCLPCHDGCLSCENSYECLQCNPHFSLDFSSKICKQNCGDGYKYILDCDDGNNFDGDGCSRDCKIQNGYSCRGGSPNTKDSCIIYQPSTVTLKQTGQIRYPTKLAMNIKADYLPKQLLQSEQCNNLCNNILKFTMIPNNIQFASLTSQYITGTSYSFTVQIQFGRSYIDAFMFQVYLNPNLKKYFENIDISRKLRVQVQPAYLSLVGNDEHLN